MRREACSKLLTFPESYRVRRTCPPLPGASAATARYFAWGCFRYFDRKLDRCQTWQECWQESWRDWCCRTGLNCRPLPYQGSALPLSYGSVPSGLFDNENRPRTAPVRRGDVCHRRFPGARSGEALEGPSGGKIGFGANKSRRLSHRFPISRRMRLVHRAGIARLDGATQYIQISSKRGHLQQGRPRGRCLRKPNSTSNDRRQPQQPASPHLARR